MAVLMQDPDIDVEHAKAVAAANGFRITAASIAAAHRLLARQDATTEIAPPKDKPVKPVAKARPGRPARRPEANLDVEALIRATAERIQTQEAWRPIDFVMRCGRRSRCWRRLQYPEHLSMRAKDTSVPTAVTAVILPEQVLRRWTERASALGS